ncbi:MAG: selenium cofactor biosynthesis protein YqeC [Geminicoccaceae bacterium]
MASAVMDHDTAEQFVGALGARSGIIAMVGAGGKKSTMYRLLEAHRALGTRRIALTSTVQIATAPDALDVETVIVDGDAEAVIAGGQGRDRAYLLTGPPTKPGRFAGLPAELIPDLHRRGGFEVSLVKADGARMRMIKAPGDNEPALPGGVSTILPIISARAFGRPLEAKLVHRPERLTEVTGAAPGMPIDADHVARLLSHPDGALRRVGDALIVPIINMVDNAERLAMAGEAARKALARTDRFDRVVLASMIGPSPLVDVISR